MMLATIHQAKTHLSKLIRKALDGEEVIIANRDKPLVRLEAVHSKKSKRKLGWGKGLVTYVAPDFDEPLGMVRRVWFHATGTAAIALRPLSRPSVAPSRSVRPDVNRAGTGRGLRNSHRRPAIQKVRRESRLVTCSRDR